MHEKKSCRDMRLKKKFVPQKFYSPPPGISNGPPLKRHSTKHGLDPWTGPKIGPKIGLKIGPKIGPKIGLKIGLKILAKILPKNPLFFRRETTLRISCFDLFV